MKKVLLFGGIGLAGFGLYRYFKYQVDMALNYDYKIKNFQILQFANAIKLARFASKNFSDKNSTYIWYLKQPSLLNSPNRSLTDYFKLLQHSRELRECLVKEASFL